MSKACHILRPHNHIISIISYHIKLYMGAAASDVLYKACVGVGKLDFGECVHGCVVKLGFDDDIHVCNTMVHIWFGDASKVCDGYVRGRMATSGVELFRVMQMVGDGVRPDEITMVSVLGACSDLGAFEVKERSRKGQNRIKTGQKREA
nr:hypothetical protein [Tanacetum cinerariifolium]